MTDPILGSIIKGTLSEGQKGFVNYILVTFFGPRYKRYLKERILIFKDAEIEARIELIDKYSLNDEDVNVLSLIKDESEVEYRNMASVLMKAVPKINMLGGTIDPDKIKKLKDLSKEFSSDDMQDLISSIIAGEYNKPGTFSLYTIGIVNNLTKDDILIFEKICSLVISNQFIFSNFFQLTPEMIEFRNKINIDYHELSYLQTIGLFSVQESSIQIGIEKSKNIQARNIGGKYYNIEIDGKKLLSSLIYLTKSGKELIELINPLYNEEISVRIKEHITSEGLLILNT